METHAVWDQSSREFFDFEIPEPAAPERVTCTWVMHGLQVICAAIWSVVGFFFWVPLLLRMTALFAALVTADAFARNVRMSTVRRHLTFAVDFYVYGFRRILELGIDRHQNEFFGRALSMTAWASLLVHVLWSAGFWWALLLGLSGV